MDRERSGMVPVTATTADLVRQKVETGAFASENDVILAALNALDRQDRDRAEDLAWVKARIRASVEDSRPGHSSDEVSKHMRELFERASRHHDSAA
jgi:antitoxin ParD1/3/4